MKKTLFIAAALIFSLTVCPYALAGETYSGRAAQESLRAGAHAGNASANASAASGQAVSAVASLPFAAIGAVGAVSTEIANGLMDAATAPAGFPLPITDEIVTAGPPPNEALKSKNDAKN